MRTIRFEILAGVGDGVQQREGTLVSLLESIPYLLISGLIPPRSVLDEILRRGEVNAGMSGGCRWEPFELSEEEWQELVREFEAIPSRGYQLVSSPAWIRTAGDWQLRVMEYRYGVPAAAHRRLSERVDRLEEERRRAVERKDEDLALSLHLDAAEAGEALARFLTEHLQPPRAGD
ncbi:MAG: hypothetical protein ACR2H9_08630 [Longimicrobiaceae bacterium]